MKYNRIVTYFLVALPSILILRLFQILFTVEADTGFFKPDLVNFGYGISVVLLVGLGGMAFFASLADRSLQDPPQPNFYITTTRILLAVTVLLEIFGEELPYLIRPWHTTVIKFFGVALAVYLMAMAAQQFIKFPIPKILAIIPLVYYIARLVCSFISISSLSFISDHYVILLCYCAVVLFAFCYACLLNKFNTASIPKKIFVTGLMSVILCATASIPNLLANLVIINGYYHISPLSCFSILALGLNIAAFTFSYYPQKKSSE